MLLRSSVDVPQGVRAGFLIQTSPSRVDDVHCRVPSERTLTSSSSALPSMSPLRYVTPGTSLDDPVFGKEEVHPGRGPSRKRSIPYYAVVVRSMTIGVCIGVCIVSYGVSREESEERRGEESNPLSS